MHDPMVVVDLDREKDLIHMFWIDLGGPMKIQWPELINKDIIRFLKILGLLLLLEKSEKFTYK